MDLELLKQRIGQPKHNDESLFSLLYEVLENQQQLELENSQLQAKINNADERIKKIEKELGGHYSK